MKTEPAGRPGTAIGLLLMLWLWWPLAGQAAVLKVFVSVPPQRFLVEQVGNGRVSVEVMVPPGQSPATYAPTPRQLAALGDAQLYFRVGVPFEAAWMKRIAAGNPGLRIVPVPELAAAGQGSGPHDAVDPHSWTSPLLATTLAAAIRDALIEADPDGRELYRRGYRQLADRLHALHERIAQLLQPCTARSFLVFHPAWGHFARTYGLEQIAVEHAGKEPASRHLAQVIDRARAKGVQAVIVQPQFSHRMAEVVAAELGIPLVTLDPLAEDWLANLEATARTLRKAMDC